MNNTDPMLPKEANRNTATPAAPTPEAIAQADADSGSTLASGNVAELADASKAVAQRIDEPAAETPHQRPVPTTQAEDPVERKPGETTADPLQVTDGEQKEKLTNQVVASPAPVPQNIPDIFIRLKEYCESIEVKCTIERDPTYVSIELKNGRTSRSVFVSSEEMARELMGLPLHKLVFLGDFAAICCYEEGWIEAAVRSHGGGSRNIIARRNIFGIKATAIGSGNATAPAEVEITGGPFLLRLTEKGRILPLLDYASPIYLRIEGILITEHDRAMKSLEDLSNSLFIQIDLRFDSPLTIAKDRPFRRAAASRSRLDEDNQLAYPKHSYDKDPSSLYWYARSATAMPLLQFLAFYQCIEYFFPQYARQETIARVKNVLKDPTFDGSKDSSVNRILDATLEGRRGLLVEERKQLGATLKHCVDAGALADFLEETEGRKQYYSKDYKKISEKAINSRDEANLLAQTSERIYDIRCKIVHTKNQDTGEGESEGIILPFSKEADLLVDDVDLIKFLARKVLIASSGTLKI